MENGATSQNCAGKGKKTDKTRRGWSEREEEVLIQALKEAITEGWKSCNGFRAGYLGFLERRMKAAFPETNLRGNPHINSKVHVWKKMYGNLVTILSKSGVGWNDTEKTIEASNETWDALIMVVYFSKIYALFFHSSKLYFFIFIGGQQCTCHETQEVDILQ